MVGLVFLWVVADLKEEKFLLGGNWKCFMGVCLCLGFFRIRVFVDWLLMVLFVSKISISCVERIGRCDCEGKEEVQPSALVLPHTHHVVSLL